MECAEVESRTGSSTATASAIAHAVASNAAVRARANSLHQPGLGCCAVPCLTGTMPVLQPGCTQSNRLAQPPLPEGSTILRAEGGKTQGAKANKTLPIAQPIGLWYAPSLGLPDLAGTSDSGQRVSQVPYRRNGAAMKGASSGGRGRPHGSRAKAGHRRCFYSVSPLNTRPRSSPLVSSTRRDRAATRSRGKSGWLTRRTTRSAASSSASVRATMG